MFHGSRGLSTQVTKHNRLTFAVTTTNGGGGGRGGGGLGRGRGITVLDSEVSTLKTVMFPNLLFLKVDIETCDTLY